MKKNRVGLFYGGVDSEREISKKSAQTARENLDPEKYEVVAIEVTPQETFIADGNNVDAEVLFPTLDVALLALHGLFGEDGTIQRLLDEYSVPYTGSDALASAVSFSKILTKEVFEKFDIQTPTYVAIKRGECKTASELEKKAQEIFTTLPQPCVIKPSTTGSSLGVSLCDNKKEIVVALKRAFVYSDKVIAEEFITGCETTVGVVNNLRDEEMYALPAVEIIPAENKKFFDTDAKYDGSTKEICPAVLDEGIRDQLSAIAKRVHTIVHLKDYSRTDFIIHPTRGIFALEVNALPAIYSGSLFAKELDVVGISMKEFLDHIIQRNIV